MTALTLFDSSRRELDESSYPTLLALVLERVVTINVAAGLAGITEAELLAELSAPEIQSVINTELTRLRLSGELAVLKANALTDTMLTRLLQSPESDISLGFAARLAELGLKFKEKANTEVADTTKFTVNINFSNDPKKKLKGDIIDVDAK